MMFDNIGDVLTAITIGIMYASIVWLLIFILRVLL